jgi:AbrB family looped-hinge helix DNA binding protein
VASRFRRQNPLNCFGSLGEALSVKKYESYTVNFMQEESDVAVVGTKGQIVIPNRFRKELGITPNTKVVVYKKDDKLILTKLKVSPLEDLKDLFKEIDQQNKGKTKPTEEEILAEIQAYRRSNGA